MRRLSSGFAALAIVLATACSAERRSPVIDADAACFGTRVLSFRDLAAEVIIPPGESCEEGSFRIVFTRGTDTLQILNEVRLGTVGFLGTADVNGDGRGEFFIATRSLDAMGRGVLYAYSEGPDSIGRFGIAPMTTEQLQGYGGGDRFGFGGGDQLVRAYPLGAPTDTAWWGYSHGEQRWSRIERPAWVR
jgi:hypothetical protein